jgi:hypothetical protein
MLRDLERQIVQDLISETQAGISSLDDNISQLESDLDTLRARRTYNIERVQKLRVAIAPHRRVPPEILGQIFLHSVHGKPVDLRPNIYSQHRVLTQICSRWRKVALRERALWDYVRLPNPEDNGPLAVLDEIMSLSRSTIALRAPIPSRWSGLTDILLRYSDRLERFEGEVSEDTGFCIVPFQSFAALRTLVLICGPKVSPVSALAALSKASQLVRLEIQATSDWSVVLSNKTNFQADFPWFQLRHLIISKGAVVSPRVSLRMLQVCMRLVSCEISFNGQINLTAVPARTDLQSS